MSVLTAEFAWALRLPLSVSAATMAADASTEQALRPLGSSCLSEESD